MKKLSLALGTIILGASTLSTAHADSYQMNDPFDNGKGKEEALKYAQSIPDTRLDAREVKDFKKAQSTEVGRLKNLKRGSSGTAFAIDKHTLLTNNHVIEHQKTHVYERDYQAAKPNELKFNAMETSTDSSNSFEIKDTHMIKNADIAIVHTKEDMTKHGIKPIKLEDEKAIKYMHKGTPIHSFGYPNMKYFKGTKFDELSKLKNPTQVKSEGYYLGQSKNTTEEHIFIQEPLRKGNSGSPILTEDNKVIGVFPNGFDNTSSNKSAYAKEQMGYAVSLIGNIREEVKQQMK